MPSQLLSILLEARKIAGTFSNEENGEILSYMEAAISSVSN